MDINELSEQFSKAPIQHKIAGLAAVLVVVSALFYFLFYSELIEESESLDGQMQQLQEEKSSYEDKKQQYMSFRAEVKKLLEEKKELVKVLPTHAEIPSFLQSLHSQTELAGLNILTFDRQKEVRRGFYAEIPVRMVISGSYHEINRFFHAVGQLKRIVNIQDVLLAEPKQTNKGVELKAKFVASTFRFVEKDGPG